MKKALFFGLATLDIQYLLDQFPEENIKVKTHPPELLVGGPATNAAVAFSVLNGGASLVTAIGHHAFVPHFQQDFAQTKIQLTDLLTDQPAVPVLATVITSANGNRTIFTHHPEEVEQNHSFSSLLDELEPELLLIDGFYPHAAVQLCREAKHRKIPIAFDGGSWKKHLPELLPFVDFAICSHDFKPPGCQTSDEVFDYLDQQAIPFKAITRGGSSVLYQTSEDQAEIAVTEVDVVDSLGAGDFFHGAFCYYFLCSRDFVDALRRASLLASQTCRFKGTRSWINKI